MAGNVRQTTKLHRDILGRLLRKKTAESVTTYEYDTMGRVTFAYDAMGNITEEKTVTLQDNGSHRETSIRYDYDELGNNIRTTLPDGRLLEYSLCGSGFLHQVDLALAPGSTQKVITAIERDSLQRETLRTMGSLHMHSAWDPMSRLKACSAIQRPHAASPDPNTFAPIKKAYCYDNNGELTRRNDSFSGERCYTYDALGRITDTSASVFYTSPQAKDPLTGIRHCETMEQTLFDEENFAYDAASNLMATGTDSWSVIPREVRASDFGGIRINDNSIVTHARNNRLKKLNGYTLPCRAYTPVL